MAAAQKVSRVQRKGQITIPLEYRQRLGIREGDYVAFYETPGGLIITHQKMVSAEPVETMRKVANFLENQMKGVKQK